MLSTTFCEKTATTAGQWTSIGLLSAAVAAPAASHCPTAHGAAAATAAAACLSVSILMRAHPNRSTALKTASAHLPHQYPHLNNWTWMIPHPLMYASSTHVRNWSTCARPVAFLCAPSVSLQLTNNTRTLPLVTSIVKWCIMLIACFTRQPSR